MNIRAAVRELSILKAGRIALAFILGAWSVSALASSNILVDCEEADTDALSTLVTVASNSISAQADEADTESEDAKEESAEKTTPPKTATTRLPGASEATLPSFRRQMLRTDI